MDKVHNFIEKYDSIKEKSIVAFGHCTHGQHKITVFMIKMFKYLVKNYGFTTFVLEEQYSCCKLINMYINGHDFDLLDIMSNFMWPYRTVEMAKLINWMKKNNNNSNLKFLGIDIQYDCDIQPDPTTEYIKKSRPNQTKDFMYRDKMMFDVFVKNYDPNEKYFICAHNAHIMKKTFDSDTRKFAGCLINEKYSDKYYALGTSFITGTYMGFDLDTGRIGTVTVNQPITKIKSDMVIQGEADISSRDPKKYLYWYYNRGKFDVILCIKNEKPITLLDTK